MFIVAKTHVNAIYANLLNSRFLLLLLFRKLNNSQMTLLETLIFTQIGSVGGTRCAFSLRDYLYILHNIKWLGKISHCQQRPSKRRHLQTDSRGSIYIRTYVRTYVRIYVWLAGRGLVITRYCALHTVRGYFSGGKIFVVGRHTTKYLIPMHEVLTLQLFKEARLLEAGQHRTVGSDYGR